jgi:adenylate cyclase
MTSSLPERRLERADGSVIPLNGNLTLGRAATNGLVLASGKASRRHASIHAQDGGEYWLIDLGSVNGTFLNGNRVLQPMRLHDGDQIELAGEQFTFRQAASSTQEEAVDATIETMPRIKQQRCWLLVADIEEFTQLSQRLAAEDLAVTMGKWVRDSREVIEKSGGIINKYLGDGFLAFWRDGVGAAGKVAAALHAIHALQASSELRFRLVLHFGAVLFGGAASLGEECLMGPEVNFVFRMEKVAGAAGVPIMCSSAARTKLDGQLATERVPGSHELKGFEGAHSFYALCVDPTRVPA